MSLLKLEVNEDTEMDYEILSDENQQYDFTFKIIVIGNSGK
jgi:hypothetical protein